MARCCACGGRCLHRCGWASATGKRKAGGHLVHQVTLDRLLLRLVVLFLSQLELEFLHLLTACKFFLGFVGGGSGRITKRFAKRTGFGWRKKACGGFHQHGVEQTILSCVQTFQKFVGLLIQRLALGLQVPHRLGEEVLDGRCCRLIRRLLHACGTRREVLLLWSLLRGHRAGLIESASLRCCLLW